MKKITPDICKECATKGVRKKRKKKIINKYRCYCMMKMLHYFINFFCFFFFLPKPKFFYFTFLSTLIKILSTNCDKKYQ